MIYSNLRPELKGVMEWNYLSQSIIALCSIVSKTGEFVKPWRVIQTALKAI
jgi:hypothetical protein